MKRIAAILIVSFIAAVAATAQQPPQPPTPPGQPGHFAQQQQPPPPPQPPQPDDPIGRYLFPPELIMNHSQQLGLQESQRTSIKNEVQKAQGRFFDLQWDLRDESDRMEALLQQRPISEPKVLEQIDRMMALEREIKRTHLTLLIRMRNILTPEQLAKLDAIRRAPR